MVTLFGEAWNGMKYRQLDSKSDLILYLGWIFEQINLW